jgi:hypothetical protein
MIRVASKNEAIQWAMLCPAADNEMIENRQTHKFPDFPAEVQDAACGFLDIHAQPEILTMTTVQNTSLNDH